MLPSLRHTTIESGSINVVMASISHRSTAPPCPDVCLIASIHAADRCTHGAPDDDSQAPRCEAGAAYARLGAKTKMCGAKMPRSRK